MQAPRSFKHEYELYLEDEIEAYKESVPRPTLLALGDEAVEALRALPEAALTEVVLCEEVDRIIARRLKLPSYRTWRRRYMKRLAELRRPERWGFATEATLVRELVASASGEHVLVAGTDAEDAVLFSAALGCSVTAVGHEAEAVGRTVAAAEASGLARRVRACVGDLDGWMPDAGLRVVLCSVDALWRLGEDARAEVIELLQRATLPGGVQVVREGRAGVCTEPNGLDGRPGWIDELAPYYAGWDTAVEDCGDRRPAFVARKPID